MNGADSELHNRKGQTPENSDATVSTQDAKITIENQTPEVNKESVWSHMSFAKKNRTWREKIGRHITPGLFVYIVFVIAIDLAMYYGGAKFEVKGKDITWQPYYVITLLLLAVWLLARNYTPSLVLITLVCLYQAAGIMSLSEAFIGFSNNAVLAIAALFVIAAAIEETGGLRIILSGVLGNPSTVLGAQIRLLIPIAVLSAFLNNTAMVAMMIPMVESWSRKAGLPKEKLMMPLSFASLFGGGLTLIGSSINLVAVAEAQNFPDWPEGQNSDIGFFDLAIIGGPLCVVGLGYILLCSPWLLKPNNMEQVRQTIKSVNEEEKKKKGGKRKTIDDNEMSLNSPVPMRKESTINVADGVLSYHPSNASFKDYYCVFRVFAESPLIGKTLEDAGLLGIQDCILFKYERQDRLFDPQPDDLLQEDDYLLFFSDCNSITDIRKINGIEPNTQDILDKLGDKRRHRRLFEVIISRFSDLKGRTVRQNRILEKYEACVIGVRTRDPNLAITSFKQIDLHIGDGVVLEASENFAKLHKRDPNFAIIQPLQHSTPPRNKTTTDKVRIFLCLFSLVLVVIFVASDLVQLSVAAILAVVFILCMQALTFEEAGRAISGNVIITIAAAFGIGNAFQQSGVADFLATSIVSSFGKGGNFFVMIGIYLATAFLSSVISNNATVVIMMHIGLRTALKLGLELKPFVYLMIFAASASYCTPIGYQTNLMVMAPGGYTFGDFFKFGFPLQLIVLIVTVVLVYFVLL